MPTVVSNSSRRGRRFSSLIIVATMAIAGLAAVLILKSRNRQETLTSEIVTEESIGTKAAEGEKNKADDVKVDSVAKSTTNHIMMVARPETENLTPITNAVIDVGKLIRSASGTIGVAGSTNSASLLSPAFETETERFLSRYASSSSRPAMIMANYTDEIATDCLSALGRDIVIYDDDPEDVIRIKEDVAALKEDLKKALEEGYSARDIFNEMARINNSNVIERIKMQRQLNELVQSNRLEEAEAFFDEANLLMEQFNMPPLDIQERASKTK